MRNLTPNGLRRLTHTEREALLALFLAVDGTWLSERKRAYLVHGHGLRHRYVQKDFDAAAAAMAKERRIRLALALMILCGSPLQATRLARWENVALEARSWTVPREHFPNQHPDRVATTGPRWDPRPRTQKYGIPPLAVGVFREARKVGDGWGLLRRIDCLPLGHNPDDLTGYGLVQPSPPAEPPRKGLVFPAVWCDPDTPLSDDAIRYRLRCLLDDPHLPN